MIVGALRYDAPLSLSLSSLLPSFFRALSNHHKRRRENDDDSLSFLSLSLEEEEEEAFCERALLVCYVVPDRCVLPSLSNCYPKFQHLKPMGVEKRSRYFPFRHTFSLDRGAQKPTESHPKKTTT